MSLGDFFRKHASVRQGPADYIICCLGNPGKKYEGTRHNAGFMTADFIEREQGIKLNKLKFHGVFGEFSHREKKLVLIKPQTFMNESGVCAREALSWYKLPPERFIVVCDDLELPCGKLRVRAKGSDGGHNGLKSIIYHLGSDGFPRVRVGIGRPQNPEHAVIDWVLGRFCEAEAETITKTIPRAAAAAIEIAVNGAASAANLYNG